MRCGQIAYCTEQGLGHLARDFFNAGVVQDTLIFRHPSGRPTQAQWYPADTPVLCSRPFVGAHVDEFLRKVDVVLCYETFFDWGFIDKCRKAGVATALMTMYEWFPEKPPDRPDLLLCPSLLDLDYFKDTGIAEFIPVPASDKVPWQQRTRARRFLHNAGHVGSRNHKGTDLVLKAAELIQSDAEITVRCQNPDTMRRLLKDASQRSKERVKIETGNIPYEQLWEGHDVLVQPERYNGLSLPLQEARAAGMLVLTTDRYPANTWLPNRDEKTGLNALIPSRSCQRVVAAKGHLEIDEAIITPEDVAQKIDEWFNQPITDYSLAGLQYAKDNSWEVLKPKYMAALKGAVKKVRKQKESTLAFA